ncbi:uncharacterized protein LOC113290360 [Papaver somniferum]|uniref:uncharacterized protein LOC113290360 n=1 Tax=Papaver somniferum TaxID=3469 RepID=UPI000E6FC701|nr:uncharacterized protein LOC113290360 [Papaver somniferum]
MFVGRQVHASIDDGSINHVAILDVVYDGARLGLRSGASSVNWMMLCCNKFGAKSLENKAHIRKISSLSALRITSKSSSGVESKESHKRKASHNKENSNSEMGDAKGPKTKKSRKVTVIKSNLSILDFNVGDVTPITTVQPLHTNSPVNPITTQTPEANIFISPVQASDANASVTFEELFPEKEPAADQGVKGDSTIASTNVLNMDQTSSSFINTDSQPNPADLSIPTDFSMPSPFMSISSSSSSSSFLLNSLSPSKKALDSVKSASQALSDIINSAQYLTNDPCKLRICSALSKLMCEFPSDRATRNDILSQIDPSFHVALDVLDSHHHMILAEGHFEYSCSQLELSQQNASLEKEVTRLKGELREVQKLRGELEVANIDAENLRSENRNLREENRILSKEKRSFLMKEAMFSHQYSILHEINDNQARTLRSLKEQYETSFKGLKSQNEKIIQSKVNLTVKKNQLQEQYDHLKHSHDVLKKKNKSLSADEKKIRSRLYGSVGDEFDKIMENMKDNTLALSNFCEDSERLHQSTITQLRSDLSKARKECTNLELSLFASCGGAQRRLAYQQNILEINARNLERGAIRKAHANSQSVINEILLSNSLHAVKLPSLTIGEDEEYPEADSDYDFLSDDEREQEGEEDHLEKDKPVSETNAEIEVLGPDFVTSTDQRYAKFTFVSGGPNLS